MSVLANFFDDSSAIEALRCRYVDSKPYNHVVIDKFCENSAMRRVHEEV